jgi:tetratricopeptide (TPR) repeat protein
MHISRTGPLFLVMVLLMVFCSGCTAGNTAKSPANLTSAPVAPDVDLYNKGFDAYIAGDNPAALALYTEALLINPKFTQGWIEKGKVLVRMNRSSDAVAAYDSAIALEPTIPEIWNRKGEALMDMGNYTAARDSFDEALRIAPYYKAAQENRKAALAKLQPNASIVNLNATPLKLPANVSAANRNSDPAKLPANTSVAAGNTSVTKLPLNASTVKGNSTPAQ